MSREAERSRDIRLRLLRVFHSRPDPSAALGVTEEYSLPLADIGSKRQVLTNDSIGISIPTKRKRVPFEIRDPPVNLPECFAERLSEGLHTSHFTLHTSHFKLAALLEPIRITQHSGT